MTDFSISRNRGETIKFTIGPVTRLAQSVDLTAAGIKVTVTAKLKSDDANPVFVKDYWQAGGAPHGGIVISQGTTDSVDVTVPATEPGVLAITKPSYLQVDVLLEEANGTKTIVARGVIKLRVTPAQ